MLEIVAYKTGKDELKQTGVHIPSWTSLVVLVLYVLIVVFAFVKAYRCSAFTGEPAAIHFLFASVSPVIYSLLSVFKLLGPC